MGYTNYRYLRRLLMAVLLTAMLIFGGCTGNGTTKKDPFFEKWATMAETQTGHSPAPRKRVLQIPKEISKETGQTTEEKAVAAARSLPTQRVSLKMRQADIKNVLRALARIADRNIFVKSEIKGEVTIDFKDTPWNQVFNTLLRTQNLTYTWEGDIIRVMTLEDVEQDLKRKTQEMGIRWVEPFLTIVIPIDYAKPKDLKDNLEAFLTRSKDDKPRGSVRVDEFSNSLIISAIRSDLEKIMPIIEQIDKPTPQIRIKANIVETTKETARQLGIQWGGMYSTTISKQNLWITPGGSSGSTTTNPLTGAYTPAFGSAGISGQGYAANFPIDFSKAAAGGAGTLGLIYGQLGGNILEMQLNALQQDSKVNILSSPSITTLDNQKAYVESGAKVPYETIDNTTSPPTKTVKFEDAVLRLEITPHVIDGQNLLMKILVKKDEVDLTRTVDGNPFIFKKQTETNLIVRDGETIVISGLTKTSDTNTNTGFPFLKDIPLLGWLFKSDSKDLKLEDLLIFITPRILQPFEATSSAQSSAQAAPMPPQTGAVPPMVKATPAPPESVILPATKAPATAAAPRTTVMQPQEKPSKP